MNRAGEGGGVLSSFQVIRILFLSAVVSVNKCTLFEPKLDFPVFVIQSNFPSVDNGDLEKLSLRRRGAAY